MWVKKHFFHKCYSVWWICLGLYYFSLTALNLGNFNYHPSNLAYLNSHTSFFSRLYSIYSTEDALLVINLINVTSRKSIFHHPSPQFHPLFPFPFPFSSPVSLAVALMCWFQTCFKLNCMSDCLEYCSYTVLNFFLFLIAVQI